MMDYFGTNSSDGERVIASIGLTASEIAMLIIPVLMGLIVVRLIALMILS